MQIIINELVSNIEKGKTFNSVLTEFKKEEKDYTEKELSNMFERAIHDHCEKTRVPYLVNTLFDIENTKITTAISLSDKIYTTLQDNLQW